VDLNLRDPCAGHEPNPRGEVYRLLVAAGSIQTLNLSPLSGDEELRYASTEEPGTLPGDWSRLTPIFSPFNYGKAEFTYPFVPPF